MITIPVYGTLSMSNQPGLSILPRQVKAKRSGFGSTSNTTVDCEVSKWGLYGECCKGKKYKTRTVVTKPSGQGKDCPKLKKQKHCSHDNCDEQFKKVEVQMGRHTCICDFNFQLPYKASCNHECTGEVRKLKIAGVSKLYTVDMNVKKGTVN